MERPENVLADLPEDARNALLQFRLQQGLKWAERLSMAWYNGNYPAGCQSGLLQSLRNHPVWGPWAFSVIRGEAPLTDEMAAEYGFKSPLQLKTSKFYPVDLDRQVIYDAPEARVSDVAARWPSNVIGLQGKCLNAESAYRLHFTVEKAPEAVAGRSGPKKSGMSM